MNQLTTKRLKELAGIEPSLRDKIEDWIDIKGEVFGPRAKEIGYIYWKQYMEELNGLDKTHPERFIEDAIKIIEKYTQDETNADEIRDDFYYTLKR